MVNFTHSDIDEPERSPGELLWEELTAKR
jgi:hypothetical protein